MQMTKHRGPPGPEPILPNEGYPPQVAIEKAALVAFVFRAQVPGRTVPIDGFITHLRSGGWWKCHYCELSCQALLLGGNHDEKTSQWADAMVKTRVSYHYHHELHPWASSSDVRHCDVTISLRIKPPTGPTSDPHGVSGV